HHPDRLRHHVRLRASVLQCLEPQPPAIAARMILRTFLRRHFLKFVSQPSVRNLFNNPHLPSLRRPKRAVGRSLCSWCTGMPGSPVLPNPKCRFPDTPNKRSPGATAEIANVLSDFGVAVQSAKDGHQL